MRRTEVRVAGPRRMGTRERTVVCAECGPLKRVFPTRTDAAIAAKEHCFAHTQGLL